MIATDISDILYGTPAPKETAFNVGVLEKDEVNIELLDVCHTFKKGHRVMIQIQSSLFPLFDRNPQKYVPSIYEAEDSDFEKAMHCIYQGSKIAFRTLKTE